MTEMRVLVGAKDYESSKSFYRDLLGFRLEEEWDAPDGRGTLYEAASGSMIEIVEDSPHHPFVPPAGVVVAVEVDDVGALYERLRQAGVEVVDPIGDRPWGHRNFEIRDPSGLPLVFFTALGPQ